MGRPSCQSSLLSDPNANFSLEMSRRSNIKEGRHVGLDFYDLLIEALMGRCPEAHGSGLLNGFQAFAEKIGVSMPKRQSRM